MVHRDLKLDNILISFPKLGLSLTKEDLKNIDLEKEEFVVKIADLGFATCLSNISKMTSTKCGSPHTIAPEVLEGKRYTFSADIWSLGCIFYEFYISDSPFWSNSLE